MKSILVLALLSIVLTVSFGSAYAEGISVQTDKLSYSEGDIILVTGTVPEILEGFNPNFIVKAPNGNLVMIDQLKVGSDKKINTSLAAGGSLMKVEGTYTILVQYGDNKNKVAETSFEFGGSTSQNGNGLPPVVSVEDTVMNDVEMSLLKSENMELKLDNKQLKNKINSLEEQIEQLNKDIQKLNEDFYGIILKQMTWFRDQISN